MFSPLSHVFFPSILVNIFLSLDHTLTPKPTSSTFIPLPSESYTPKSSFHPQAMFSPSSHILTLEPCSHPRAMFSFPIHTLIPEPCSHPQTRLVTPGQATTLRSTYSHPRAILSLLSQHILHLYHSPSESYTSEPSFYPRAILSPLSHPQAMPRSHPRANPQANIFSIFTTPRPSQVVHS